MLVEEQLVVPVRYYLLLFQSFVYLNLSKDSVLPLYTISNAVSTAAAISLGDESGYVKASACLLKMSFDISFVIATPLPIPYNLEVVS